MRKQSAADIKKAKELAILSASALYHYKLIARSVGRDEDTLLVWRTEDKQFSDKLEIARTEFLGKHMKKARPEFLLERLERELFAPPKQQTELTGDGTNPIRLLLDAYGVRDDGKIDGSIQEPPKSQT